MHSTLSVVVTSPKLMLMVTLISCRSDMIGLFFLNMAELDSDENKKKTFSC